MPRELGAIVADLDELRAGAFAPYPKLKGRIRRAATKTPRTQHGAWRTNRESRWAIDPESPHYAGEAESREVELKLLVQCFEFDGAPVPSDREKAIAHAVLEHDPVVGAYRCPLSGRRMDFEKLVDSTDRAASHGRSQFAVGHMQPLGHEGARGRHEAQNTTWVHEQGNRIQGNLNLDQAVDEIFRVADFHRRGRGLTWADVESIAKERPPAPDELVIADEGEVVG